MRSARPGSPCVNICTLDDENVCMGCCRTLDEIKAWATMSGVEQWQLIADLAARTEAGDNENGP